MSRVHVSDMYGLPAVAVVSQLSDHPASHITI